MLCLIIQSRQTPCDPMNCSLPASFVHGFLQATVLELVPCPPVGNLPNSGIEPTFLMSRTGRRVLYLKCHLGNLLLPKFTKSN